jgi:hypothetical protein
MYSAAWAAEPRRCGAGARCRARSDLLLRGDDASEAERQQGTYV